ncbi:MAG: hypothetical protein WC763_06930 [Candidatus Paceibacterota bacterium]|jgi:hypothetical protein
MSPFIIGYFVIGLVLGTYSAVISMRDYDDDIIVAMSLVAVLVVSWPLEVFMAIVLTFIDMIEAR